jgi:hypothetical protein
MDTDEEGLRLLDPITARSIRILQGAIRNIYERGKSYNQNGVDYSDYRLNNLESTWEEILECFTRLWNTGNPDKAEDWAAYAALQAAYIEAGCPQSLFSPAFARYIGAIQRQIKEVDIDGAETVDHEAYSQGA